VAAFGSSSNFFKSASLLLKGDAIFYAFPSDEREGIPWFEVKMQNTRFGLSGRAQSAHSAARPLQKRAHLEKQKKLFLLRRALCENWFLSAVCTMAHLEFLRHFTHIQHVNARSRFSARLFGEK